mmetsp:Transcript_20764/g.26815  ORF Transcript_20764/g.26815 Transcript_20764/m.26815 type:complete len:291 (+) Transcript_20764:67-939(+)
MLLVWTALFLHTLLGHRPAVVSALNLLESRTEVAPRHHLDISSSRRGFFTNAAAQVACTSMLLGASTSLLTNPQCAAAAAPAVGTTTTDREQLLQAIGRGASEEQVIQIINGLQDPSEGKGAIFPERLDGQWELIWSYKAEAFSPLLKLPKPFRPDSYQYFGSVAAAEVGEGRIAQGLTGGVLGNNHLWLSSGAIPLKDTDPSILEIQPPFRLQLGGRAGSGQPKKTLVESGSDADFRKVNARTTEAQEAGKNLYQQMYLENSGPGSLRVSGVIAGDPVLVGELFVHRKL